MAFPSAVLQTSSVTLNNLLVIIISKLVQHLAEKAQELVLFQCIPNFKPSEYIGNRQISHLAKK